MSAEQNERVVFPDEVEDAKRAAAEKASDDAADAGAAEVTEETPPPEVTLRNMITVPANCPAGFKPDANGVCREIMD